MQNTASMQRILPGYLGTGLYRETVLGPYSYWGPQLWA